MARAKQVNKVFAILHTDSMETVRDNKNHTLIYSCAYDAQQAIKRQASEQYQSKYIVIGLTDIMVEKPLVTD